MPSTGKVVEVLFENTIETYETQEMMLPLVNFYQPDAKDMQNADNFVWRTAQQHAPIIDGWDLSTQEQDIIQEMYPAVLGVPKNDLVSQRADQMRDMQFWEDRGKASGKRQASELNKSIVNAMTVQGSMFYRSNAASGYDFVSEAQVIMNERQGMNNKRCFMLNDRDTKLFAGELAGRQTLQGRPEDEAWSKGQIGANVAEFGIYTGSFLPNLSGGVPVSTTVTGNQTFAPEGGTVDAITGVVTNIDYRSAVIPVAASSAYSVGDKVTINNSGTPVMSIGLDDKTETGQAMTFTIVGAPSSTTLKISPKPIAANDSNLNPTELSYANIDTQILDSATVVRVNSDASNKTNLFWDKDAVEVLGGTIPAELFKQFDGMKVINHTMKNGQEMYMIYDGDMATMNFRYRLFTWYGITIKDPSRVGVAVTF